MFKIPFPGLRLSIIILLLPLAGILSACGSSQKIRYELTVYLNDNGKHIQKSVVGDIERYAELLPSIDNGTAPVVEYRSHAQAMPVLIDDKALIFSAAKWSSYGNIVYPPCTGSFNPHLNRFQKGCNLLSDWSPLPALERSSGVAPGSDNEKRAFQAAADAFSKEIELLPEEVPAVFTFDGEPSWEAIRILDSANLPAEFGAGVLLEKLTVKPTNRPLRSSIIEEFPFTRANATPPSLSDWDRIKIKPFLLFYSYPMSILIGGML